MNVICFQDKAFYALVEEVLNHLEVKFHEVDVWVCDAEAMRLLNIKSKTTLQKLRDEGKIRFSQPQKKIILYDRLSIHAYIEKHAQATF